MLHNAHISSMGFRVEYTDDVSLVRTLLEVCGLTPLDDLDDNAPNSEYLIAATSAGGIAACAGWTSLEDCAVLHSLAVAPPSRGSGVGASLLATAMGYVMDRNPIASFYLATDSARRFFASFGFVQLETEDIPDIVSDHITFSHADEQSTFFMARHYRILPRGLDQCVLRIVQNDAEDAVMPDGSLIYVEQSGPRLEARYRGGPVQSGHLLGRINQDEIEYLWHAFSREGELLDGRGHLHITARDDGRRELIEYQSESEDLKLIMREV